MPERYFAETIKCRGGWPTIHAVNDRGLVPTSPVRIRKTRAAAERLAREMNAAAGPFVAPPPRGHREELRQLREWAQRTEAFTKNNVDLVFDEAA